MTGSWCFWSLKNSNTVFCCHISQKLLGRSTLTFGIKFLATADMHNKLLVEIWKRALEPLLVHEKSLNNENDFYFVFQILNVVNTNHYAYLCKISSCYGDRKLRFLKPKNFKICFCYRFSQNLLGQSSPNFDIMYLITRDMQTKLLVAIRKRAPEHFRFTKIAINENDLCCVFKILNVFSNHYQNVCMKLFS